jgi:hypothetical protein
MKTHKLLIPIIALAVLGSSCSKDSKPSLSSTQAEKAIGDVNTNLASEIGSLQATQGNVALTSFTTITATTSPFGRIQSFNKPGEIKAALSASLISVRQMIVSSTGGEKVQGASEAFNFDGKKGIYIYNFDTQVFDKSQETSTIIKIRYPKDDASKTNHLNDAELQITTYTDTPTPQGYNPTAIEAAIYISSVKEASLSLTAQYDDAGDPNKASETLYINPYTFSFSFDITPATSATESFSLSKSGTTLIAVGATAVWSSASEKTNGNGPKTLTGYFQLKNLRFSIAVDGTKGATAASNNEFITITVTADGSLAGHVVWATDPNNPNGGEQPYMQYNDGNKELLSTLFADLGSQLQALANG